MKTITYNQTIRAGFTNTITGSDREAFFVGISNFNKFLYSNVHGNCKVCNISNIQNNFLAGGNAERCVNRIKELFTYGLSKLVFRTTFTDKRAYDRCAEFFDPVYCKKVPIGYGSGYQYHCAFLLDTGYGGHAQYSARIKKEQVQKPKVQNEPVEISMDQFKKLKSYKRRDYAVKYMLKLINGENL